MGKSNKNPQSSPAWSAFAFAFALNTFKLEHPQPHLGAAPCTGHCRAYSCAPWHFRVASLFPPCRSLLVRFRLLLFPLLFLLASFLVTCSRVWCGYPLVYSSLSLRSPGRVVS